jgi:Arc/MetJ-type ribon-helix-helix transcriptional regulator
VAHSTSVVIDDRTYKRISFASAGCGASVSEYIRASVTAALMTHAENDPVVRAAFRAMDEFEKQDAAEKVAA